MFNLWLTFGQVLSKGQRNRLPGPTAGCPEYLGQYIFGNQLLRMESATKTFLAFLSIHHHLLCHLSFCFAFFMRAENTTSTPDSISVSYTVQPEPDESVRFTYLFSIFSIIILIIELTFGSTFSV